MLAGWGLRFGRWTAALVAAAALLLALGVGVFRLAIELLPEYQQRVVDRVRETTGLRLEFDSVEARIGRYGPEVVFRGARVLPAEGGEPLVSADSGRVSLSIARSLWYRRAEVGRVVLLRPRLNFVIDTDGSIRLVGQDAFRAPPDPERPPLTLERLPRGIFAIHDATLEVLDLRARHGRFALTGAYVAAERKGDEVTILGHLKLPEHLGSGIEFEGSAEGELADAASLAWRARIDAHDLQFAQWAALLPDSYIVPAAGRGSVEASARGTGRELATLRLRPRIADMTLAAGEVPFTRVAGDIRLQRGAGTLSVQATGLEFSRKGQPWRPTNLKAGLKRQNGRVASLSARADYLRIENLAAFAVLLPPGMLRDRVAALAPRGELFGLDFRMAGAGAKRLPDITGRVRFSDLGFEPYRRVAGVTGLDGAIEGRGGGGVVHLATRDAAIKWPLQWRSLATVRRAEGRVEWSRFNDGVRIWLDDGAVDTGHGSAQGRLRMVFRPGELPLMDLSATARDMDLRQTWRYLPIEKLKPKSLAWLDAAFRAGRVTEGQVSITGPVRGFPYREGQGRFVASGRASGVTLHYAPGWPDVHGIEGEARFEGPALHAVASRGVIGDIPFTQAEVNSADLRQAIVALRASAHTDAGRAIRLLQSSPLAPSFGSAFAGLSAAGPVAGEIAMYLPIKDFQSRVVTVMATLSRVSLRHEQQAVEMTDIEGDLWVRNREIHAPALTARLLGGPLRASIATTSRPDGGLSTQVEGNGRTRVAQLRPIARLPVNAELSGAADWHGVLNVERQADPSVPARGTLEFDSDLRGLASGLPEPFAKTAEAARPLAVRASFGGASAPRIEAHLGDDVHALLQWREEPAEPPIRRGIVAFGASAPAALPRADGLWLSGRLEKASLTELLRLKWDRPRGRPISDWLGGADLTVGSFEALGYRFANVSGKLRPGHRAWEVDVNSPAATGHLVVPYTFPGEVPMVLDLDRLHFGEPVTGREDGTDPDPRQLPAISVDLRDFVFDQRHFGHVKAELARGTTGITLNQFTMQHPAFSAKGRGSWLMQERGAECRLEFEAQTGDVLGFMQAMQLGSLIEGKSGHVSATLSWPGPPEVSALERLSGRIQLAAEDGSLTSLEPGAGRVFGLMSLAHLPRRLALDFGDLTGEGLAYDTLRGTFRVNDGEAFTDNLTLRGSAAEIGVAGRTSLKDRTYDQTAIVTGQLGASLGVAGALAGGPAVGAALLLFSQIFKEPLKGATRGYYRITGSWDDPEVRRIDARELKDDRQAGAAQ